MAKVETTKAPEAKAPEAALQRAFNKVVKERITSPDSGWGAEDSSAVIEALVAEEMPAGQVPSDKLMEYISLVINPSQFRQRLESKGLLTKPPEGSRRARHDLSFLS